MARAANARLPVARLEIEMAQHSAAEVRARQRLRLLVEGDYIYAPPQSYDTALTDTGEERLQLAAERTLLDGGARAAERDLAASGIDLATARYQQTERDVELDVRLRFAAILASEAELRSRRAAIRRLQTYTDLLTGRQRAGQPVSADLLRTRVELQTERADLLALKSDLVQQRMSLNVTLGRAPGAPLSLAPLPAPSPPGDLGKAPWRQTPEVEIARQQSRAAAAELKSARAARRPQLSARADTGLWGSDTTNLTPHDLGAGASFGDRLNRDAGYSFSLNFSWPIDALGAFRERVAAAELGTEQTNKALTVQELDAHLHFAQARHTMATAYRRYRVLSDTQPIARDAYLEIESRYRGGSASALEVLDAATAALNASVQSIQAKHAYYEADALARRWGGTP